MAAKSEVLLKRKQQIVRDAIWSAAIDLFGKKGFDQTTVDDIVAAAGVSQRTFFRYFASKSDLMGQGILAYGEALKEAIEASPRSADAFDVLQRAVLEIATRVASFPRARDVIAVSIKYPAAREAQRSRMGEVEESIACAFAARMKKGREQELTGRLLAGLTLTIVDVTMRLWYADGAQDVTLVAAQVIQRLRKLVPGGVA